MQPRSIAQLALLVIGVIVWGYGMRVNDERLRWIGVGCFAAAFLLRFLRKRDPSS
ncbi:MAG TPA: hypothetical protein VGM82_14185 [Gemmatimonadaceae bacterium]|jgi:hypothetical protein